MPGSGLIISARLDPQLSGEFTAMCEKKNLERSALLRDLLRDWLLKEQARELEEAQDYAR